MPWSIVPQATYFSKKILFTSFLVWSAISTSKWAAQNWNSHFRPLYGSSTLHKENIIEFINLTMTLLISVIIFVYLSSSEHQLLKSRISFCRLIPRSCEALDSHLSVLRCKCLMCQQIRKSSDCLFTEGTPDQQAESEDQHEACTFTLLKGTRLESTSGARYLTLG